MKVLLVEDSVRMQNSIARGLRRSGYAVDVCGDGAVALRIALAGDFDVIVLDILLPGLDGWGLLERLRTKDHRTAVLIVSALDQVEDRVRGLRMGADDYLVKPFSFDELVARIDALTRRQHDFKTPEIVIGDVVVDTARKSVRRGETPINLTAREYRLLEYLAYHRGRPVSREEIEEHIYAGGLELASNAVDSAICMLRSKLDDKGGASLIQTRRGFGYSIDVEASRGSASCDPSARN